MADIAAAIIVLGILAFIAVTMSLKAKSDLAQRQMIFEAQKHLLDKLSSGPEVTEFLGSQAGREFFERLKPPGKPPNYQPKPHEILFLLIWMGLIVTLIGAGFIIGAFAVNWKLLVPGLISGGCGVGLLLGLWITHKLSWKWGIIKPTHEGAQNS